MIEKIRRIGGLFLDDFGVAQGQQQFAQLRHVGRIIAAFGDGPSAVLLVHGDGGSALPLRTLREVTVFSSLASDGSSAQPLRVPLRIALRAQVQRARNRQQRGDRPAR